MANKRTVSREQHYKSIIEKQKRIIQELKKKIGRAGKLEDRYADDIEEIEARLLEADAQATEKEAPVAKNACPTCRQALEVIDGSRRKIYICHNCGYRKSSGV